MYIAIVVLLGFLAALLFVPARVRVSLSYIGGELSYSVHAGLGVLQFNITPRLSKKKPKTQKPPAEEKEKKKFSFEDLEKMLSKGVDVLTLSATPIPRTLNMALSGIRDMSTIEEPPADRYPVQTFVMEHSNAIIDDAIRREIERGGQIYYLHNNALNHFESN